MKEHKARIINMTEGSPLDLIVRFSIPMLIGNLFQQLYNLADSMIVGRFLGADALAAIGSSSSITFMFFALCNGIGSGGGIITSQCFGRGDARKVRNCITNTGYIMLLFPMIVGIIAFMAAGPLLKLLNTPDNIITDATNYVKIMCIGLLFVSIYNFISSILRALGDSTTPLIFLVISCFLNVGLDILFVYVFNTGVVGAAIATIIAQFLSGICCLIFAFVTNPYFKLTRNDFAFDKALTLSVLKLGIPLSLQFSLIAISCMALQRVVNSFGSIAVAAFTATSRVEQLIHQPYGTLGSSLSTFTGQNYGARKLDRVYKGYHLSLVIMAVFSVLMLPFMYLFGNEIVGLFVEDAAVIEMGSKALRITSLFYILLGTLYVIRGVLNGLGDGFFSLLNGIVEVIGRFTVPLFMIRIPALDVYGIWTSVGIVWAFAGITAIIRYVYFKKKISEKL